MPSEQEQINEVLQSIFPFRLLKDEQMELVTARLQRVELEKNLFIFKEEETADQLFIILRGRVSLTRYNEEEEKDELLAILKTGDILGFDMLDEHGRYTTSGKTITGAVLLKLSKTDLVTLEEEISLLEGGLDILYDSYHAMLRVPLEWRDADEAVYYLARRHPAFLILRFIPMVVSGLIAFAVILGMFYSRMGGNLSFFVTGLTAVGYIIWGIYNFMEWGNDYSIITDRRVVYQEKVIMIYDSRQEAPLDAILAVSTDTSQLGRLLGYGDVVVRTFTGTIILPDIPHPEFVMALLEGEWFRAKAGYVRAEKLTQVEAIIRERLGMEPDEVPVEEDLPIRSIIEPGKLQNFFANIFKLRRDESGTIIYRTHWVRLLKRTWMPALFLTAILILVILGFLGYLGGVNPVLVLEFALVAGLVIGAWWLYEYMDWRNDAYIISDENLVDVNKRPLGREEKRAAPIRNVQSIEFTRVGLAGLILNYGTVTIRVGETELTFDYVFNPSEVQQEIFKRLAKRDYNRRQAEILDDQARLADWIEAYHHIMQQEKERDEPGQPDST
ncbi:MAG: cyclic nucleotide-binding domain-containing protein [Anaerolineaceae bacterium]|nr:cyclic nucleotide-binding domain-containing protein [Anaerolineaceae bacterium]